MTRKVKLPSLYNLEGGKHSADEKAKLFQDKNKQKESAPK